MAQPTHGAGPGRAPTIGAVPTEQSPRVPPARALGRRRFVGALGGLGGGALLAACGESGSTSTGAGLPEGLAIVQRFPNNTLVPGEVRLPVSLANIDGLLFDGNGTVLPDELTFSLTNIDTGDVIASSIAAAKHGAEMPVPYWPVVTEVSEPGFYSLTLDGSDAASAGVQVLERGSVPVPSPGSPLPGFATPTLDDPRGVETVCTRTEGACPFHGITLEEALTTGKPVVYLVGTPAFCQTGVCAPALEAVIAIAERVGDAASFVHADVYSDAAATVPAPAVTFYGMTYEPALFVTDGNGTLVTRLDGVFDADEIASTLVRVGVS